MKALIMAAGRGTRISRYLDGKPKCTVNIGNMILIENTIKQLNKNGISDIAMIIGYKGEIIEDILKDYNIKFYYNYFYDVTNSVASAWFARDFITSDEDILILNGDVFFEEELLNDILNEKLSPVLFCDNTRKEEADYKFYYENNKLIKYGKELKGNEITGEYIGIAKIDREFTSVFKESLCQLIKKQRHDLWWENALYSLIPEYDIFVKDIKGKFWAEVDFIEDYERILKFRNYKINFNIKVVKSE